WRDEVRVTAECTRIGTTSFTVEFGVCSRTAGGAELVAVRGRNVYVVVSIQDWTKRPVPELLREALSSNGSQRR
ncbi:MAG: acyl-CoA thioesterase, partial [Mycobacterium sp.]|nr:acyl-CoA thioesterase [Mycobacterium sp.]